MPEADVQFGGHRGVAVSEQTVCHGTIQQRANHASVQDGRVALKNLVARKQRLDDAIASNAEVQT
jgi:hypothetical protein